MKTKKKDIVGIIISFLMIFFLIFPSISNRIMKNGLKAGRKKGYNDNFSIGYSKGFDDGYDLGYSDGLSFGYDEGYIDSGIYDDSDKVVYCSFSENKYHYSKDCSSSELKEMSLLEALEHHLKPCSKCVPLSASTAP